METSTTTTEAEIASNIVKAVFGKEEPRAPLQWLDMSTWDNEPVPARKWAIPDRVPANQAGLLSGAGSAGKSNIELMKDVAHVASKDWLYSMPEPGPAFYIGAEDDKNEIHIRLAAICEHYGVTFKQLVEGGLHVLCLLGEDATLCAPARNGRIETTALYRQLYEAAGDIKPKNISVDTVSRAFAGNEIDRAQVYQFAMHMQKLALVMDGGAVTVLMHPSLAGIASDSGLSGSTGWQGAFRFHQYLKGMKPTDGDEPDNDIRELTFKKNQCGPLGESIILRYQRGLFLPEASVSGLDKLAREAKVEGIFLDLLKQLTAQGRNVSEREKANAFAPRIFADEAAAKEHRIRKPEFEAAMRRLFDANNICVENYGRPSRPNSRLALK